MELILIGTLDRKGFYEQLNRVYDPRGIAPNIVCCGGIDS